MESYMPPVSTEGALSGFFQLQQHNTDVRTELLAGLTTFVTMAYILFVNPQMMASAGMDHGAAFVATCLGAALCHAQTQISCNITEVKVEQLSNAVEITLKADGLLSAEADRDDFIPAAGGRRWREDIPLRITNARSVIGTFASFSTTSSKSKFASIATENHPLPFASVFGLAM